MVDLGYKNTVVYKGFRDNGYARIEKDLIKIIRMKGEDDRMEYFTDLSTHLVEYLSNVDTTLDYTPDQFEYYVDNEDSGDLDEFEYELFMELQHDYMDYFYSLMAEVKGFQS
jgi:hypothetical protein